MNKKNPSDNSSLYRHFLTSTIEQAVLATMTDMLSGQKYVDIPKHWIYVFQPNPLLIGV